MQNVLCQIICLHIKFCHFKVNIDTLQITTTVFHCDSSEMKLSEVAQSCPTLFDPTRFLHPRDFQGRILEWVAIKKSTQIVFELTLVP